MRNTIIVFAFGLTACGQSTFTVSGEPVSIDAVYIVHDYMLRHGPEALNVDSDGSALDGLRNIEFVKDIFPCEKTTCLGVTHGRNDGAWITSALITDDYAMQRTSDVRCTSLAHELAHVLSGQLTGDSDHDHTNAALWGRQGLVQRALLTLCPSISVSYPRD